MTLNTNDRSGSHLNHRGDSGDTVPPSRTTEKADESPIQPVTFAKPAAGGRVEGSRGRHRITRLLVWSALAILAVALWFVFSARHVRIIVEPDPEQFGLTGGLLRLPLAEGYLLRPGTYRLRAEKTGYHPLVGELVVTSERRQIFNFVLEKLPGILAIRTSPVDGAQVVVDGTDRGTTPLVINNLVPGSHEILVRSERYVEARQAVEIEGRGIRQELVVKLVPRWATITVLSEPTGALLWIDGEQTGPTPLAVELFAGQHVLELRKPGYKTWGTQLEVQPNDPQEVGPVVLEEADGTLRLSSIPAGANVTVDGRYAGVTPLDLVLPPGKTHRIVLSKAGYRLTNRETKVQADEVRELNVSLDAMSGMVRVIVEPKDAEVLVDGKSQGRGSRTLRLVAVPHRVEVRKKGFQSFRTQVTPRPGYSQAIRAALRRPGSLSPGSRPQTIAAPDGQRLRLVEPGQFVMGASRREQGRRGNETLRKVALTRPFYIGTQEVTNAQFRRFQPRHSAGNFMGVDLNGNNQPVVNVSWEQAAGYCNWLNKQASLPTVYEKKGGTLVAKQPLPLGYRLPTEAEWAWVARAAGRRKPDRFPWGNAMPPPDGSGNYADQTAVRVLANTLSSYSDGYPGSSPTGKFKANSLGLYDLGGNVAEWTHDYYTIYPYAPNKAIKDPKGPPEGKHHTVRGSSWMHASISSLRWTFRDYSNKARPDLGFRCARYAD